MSAKWIEVGESDIINLDHIRTVGIGSDKLSIEYFDNKSKYAVENFDTEQDCQEKFNKIKTILHIKGCL